MSRPQPSSSSSTEKLRSSCDSCHLSKVKCSKTRPLCSRCLICGTDCTYSPSARVGRKRKGEPVSNYVVPRAQRPRQYDAVQFHAKPSVSASSISTQKEEEMYTEFDQDSLYSTNTPSTSGYMTPAISDTMANTMFLEPDSSPDGWIQTPGVYGYFPWTSDAVYPALVSPEIIPSDPNNPWEIWYNTEAAATPSVDPGILQNPPDSSPFPTPHSCRSSTS